jgi:hypothetical protein
VERRQPEAKARSSAPARMVPAVGGQHAQQHSAGECCRQPVAIESYTLSLSQNWSHFFKLGVRVC